MRELLTVAVMAEIKENKVVLEGKARVEVHAALSKTLSLYV